MTDASKNRENAFFSWLTDQVSPARISEMREMYTIIDDFCIEKNLLNQSLLQTTDIDKIKLVQKTIERSREFRFKNRGHLYEVSLALREYVFYIKKGEPLPSNQQNVIRSEQKPGKAPQKDSLTVNVPPVDDLKKKAIIPKTTETVAGLAGQARIPLADSAMKVDFHKDSDLSYTRPVYASYCGKELRNIEYWSELYTSIFLELYRDHKEQIPLNQPFLSRNGRLDFCTREYRSHMIQPKEVAAGRFLEINLSAKDIIHRIQMLLDVCQVSEDNLIIMYRKKDACTKNGEKKRRNIPPERSTTHTANLSDTVHRKKTVIDDSAMKAKYPKFYKRLHFVSKIFDNPGGLAIEKIAELIQAPNDLPKVREILSSVSWAWPVSEKVFTFAEVRRSNANVLSSVNSLEEKSVESDVMPTDFDKDEFIRVLMQRYQSGMQFDSIDLENFRDTYKDLYDRELPFSDDELKRRLRYCGIFYQGRLFPAEGIIDQETSEKLFSYIDGKFAEGNQTLYYKAIYEDLADAFAYCFSLTDERMLKAYIEFTAAPGKYYFHDDFMSVEKEVAVDPASEIEDFMLKAGKPLSYEEVYEGLTHISRDVINREIHANPLLIRNENSHYFHIDIFELSQDESAEIVDILNQAIEEDGFAIWPNIYDRISDTMHGFLENNLYLSSLGIREALSRKLKSQFNFNGTVICHKDKELTTADIYRLYAKHHPTFTDTEINDFSKKVGTIIYFDSLADESVRVSKELFVSKDQVSFDVEEIDRALGTYLSSGYVLVKDIDSFLVFPNVGYEWNVFLLQSYLLYYSKKFSLINNGSNLNSVTGAVVKKDGEFTQFVDICAHALAESGIELNSQADSLNYLARIHLIARRVYKDIDVAMTKARQIRNRKG